MLKLAAINGWFPVKHHEWPAVIFSFSWFFMLMTSYLILRPIRESLGSGLGTSEINWLFLYTFLAMLVAVPVFAKLVTIVRRRWLVQLVFQFLTFNILSFAFALWTWDVAERPFIARLYFVWVSVFSLFSVSVFWSVLADLFSNEQGKRLFGLISSGATLGAISGSLIASWLSELIGLPALLVISAACLEIGIVFAALVQRATHHWPAQKREVIPSGNVFSGIMEIGRSRYLMTMCAYLALISICGTMIYMQLADAANESVPDRNTRTAFFAQLNFWVQLGTLIIQVWVVGPVMRRLGLSVALIVLPIVYFLSFVVLGLASSLMLLGLIDVTRRIAVYGMTSPSREVLFTVVSREAKYKSKNFMDTVVIRGCDAATSSLYVFLKSLFASIATIGWVMMPVTVLWVAIGWSVGRQQDRQASMPR